MKNLKYDVFVCTKPFQWINVENIKKNNSNNVLIIINSFPDVENIAKRIKEVNPYWNSIIIVKNRFAAFKAIRKLNVRNLYVDSDYGRKSYLYAFIKAHLFVYDEGIGTYSIDLKAASGIANKIKYWIFKAIGAATFQGGGFKTSGVILYNIPYYKHKYGSRLGSKVVSGFSLPLDIFIQNNLNKLLSVFQFDKYSDLKGKRILLYLTFHTLRNDIIEYLKANAKFYDLVIVKPHPHLLKFGDITPLNDQGFEILQNPIMAEVLISMLSKNNHITVLHESSSACLNLTQAANVELVDFENKLFSKDFENYVKFVKNESYSQSVTE